KSLLTASFGFHLTMDTLAVRLYTSSLPRRVRDFHPLERAHGAQTKREGLRVYDIFVLLLLFIIYLGFSLHNPILFGISLKVFTFVPGSAILAPSQNKKTIAYPKQGGYTL
ncbi:MAG: hypothetical protein MSA59_08450, partial [Lachnobacterium sp.]|nr:hypothetical protein [Lachnobacterium sp.]